MTQPDLARLEGLLSASGFTWLVADYISAEVAGEPDCAIEEGWRIHDFPPAHGDPKRPKIAHFIAEGLEEGEAKFLVAAVNELPALLARVGELTEALEPFATFADTFIDAEGWNGPMSTTRIVDWFGPSDFRRALAALTLNRSETDAG